MRASRAALVAAVAASGYAAGRYGPVRHVRAWADRTLTLNPDAGPVQRAIVVVVLPETTVPVLWHRIRYGRYPEPPPRRPRRPAPALIIRSNRADEQREEGE